MDCPTSTDFAGAFTRIERNGMTALVRVQDAAVIADALLDGAGCVPLCSGGRGTVFRFPLPEGSGIVRPYRRGGLMRHFISEGYLLENRPLRELRTHWRCVEKGLSVPEPLGVCWGRSGFWLRGAIATREASGVTLLQYLQESRGNAAPMLALAGAAVFAMHEAGVWHADLQVRNFLVANDRIVLLDFDKARIAHSLSATARTRNLLRLRRSFDKNGFSGEMFEVLYRAYGPLPLGSWNALYRAKGWLSDAIALRGRHGK